MKKIFIYLIICLSCLTKTFADTPKRLISLVPSITEELYLLGVQDQLVGCTMYCRRPKEAMDKEKVANAVKMNIEKVLLLKPDIVFASTLFDKRQIRKLESAGVNVIVFPISKDFDSLCKYFLKLGRLTGKEDLANKIITENKKKINAIIAQNKIEKSPKVFIQIGVKPLFAATRDYAISDIIKYAGGINIAYNAKTGIYSKEEVLRQNPDIIFIVTMGMKNKEKQMWLKYKSLKAVRNNKIFLIDAYKACSLTPVTFVELLDEIVLLV